MCAAEVTIALLLDPTICAMARAWSAVSRERSSRRIRAVSKPSSTAASRMMDAVDGRPGRPPSLRINVDIGLVRKTRSPSTRRASDDSPSWLKADGPASSCEPPPRTTIYAMESGISGWSGVVSASDGGERTGIDNRYSVKTPRAESRQPHRAKESVGSIARRQRTTSNPITAMPISSGNGMSRSPNTFFRRKPIPAPSIVYVAV